MHVTSVYWHAVPGPSKSNARGVRRSPMPRGTDQAAVFDELGVRMWVPVVVTANDQTVKTPNNSNISIRSL